MPMGHWVRRDNHLRKFCGREALELQKYSGNLNDCATERTKVTHSHMFTYLDVYELAQVLGVSVQTITLRAKQCPWLLLPRA